MYSTLKLLVLLKHVYLYELFYLYKYEKTIFVKGIEYYSILDTLIMTNEFY